MTYSVLQMMFSLPEIEAKKYCAHFELIATDLNKILSEKNVNHVIKEPWPSDTTSILGLPLIAWILLFA